MSSSNKALTLDQKRDYLEVLFLAARDLEPKLHNLCLYVLHDREFAKAPGGASYHHDYEGGLLQHTAEVVNHTRLLSGDYTYVNRDALITAAIWHDYHKIHEYEILPDGSIKKLEYRNLIGHVTGSTIEFAALALKRGVDEWVAEMIIHIMLSHHGRLEWRSPVEPRTMEAFILHSADMLSARAA